MIDIPERKPKINLLVVDDDTELTDFLRDGLERYFSLVAIAYSVADAKGYVSGRVKFNAVLCDYYLPDGNGLDFYSWLRKERHLMVPFILISGQAEIKPTPGQDFTFLPKPFTPNDILERLRLVVGTA
jgi:DNA-binding NtrC family response regulator